VLAHGCDEIGSADRRISATSMKKWICFALAAEIVLLIRHASSVFLIFQPLGGLIWTAQVGQCLLYRCWPIYIWLTYVSGWLIFEDAEVKQPAKLSRYWLMC